MDICLSLCWNKSDFGKEFRIESIVSLQNVADELNCNIFFLLYYF